MNIEHRISDLSINDELSTLASTNSYQNIFKNEIKNDKKIKIFDPVELDLGKDFPNKIPAYIEISAESKAKYEYDKDLGCLMLDRILSSSVTYPADYGFIPKTLCGDGDPLDVLILGSIPLVPGCVAMVKPIGYLEMSDEKGQDEKLIAVLDKDPRFKHCDDIDHISPHLLDEISEFFKTYKNLEKGKYVNVNGFKNKKQALQLIKQSNKSYEKTKKQ